MPIATILALTLAFLPAQDGAASPGALVDRAIAHLNAQELEEAEQVLTTCLEQPADPRLHGLARTLLGIALQRGGERLEEARDLILASRDAAASFGTDIAALADNSLAHAALALGEAEAAQQAFERVLEESQDPALRLLATSGLARAAADQGDLERAGAFADAALAAVGEAEGLPPDTASEVLFDAGRVAQARAAFVLAADRLGRAAETAGTARPRLRALGQLGLVELVRGRYGPARDALDRAESLAREFQASAADVDLLRSRAALAFALGEYGVAQDTLESILPLQPDDQLRAEVTADQALLAFVRDDFDGSEALYDEALRLAPEPSRARWLALNGKASLLFEQDLAGRAAPLAFEAAEVAGVVDDPYLATVSLLGVSEAHLRAGDAEAARAASEAAVAALDEQDAGDLLLPAWHGVARAALAQGDEDTAADFLARAWAASSRPDIADLAPLQSALVRSRLAELSDWGELAADLAGRRAARDPSLAEELLASVGRWKARALRSDLAGDEHEPAPWRTDDVVAGLSAVLGDRALVEYAFGDRRLYAFVVEGGGAPGTRLVDLGDRRPVEALVREYLAGLSDSSALAPAEEVVRLGSRLHAALLEPLGVTHERLVFVPSGELARLPFEALVVSAPPEPDGFRDVRFVLDVNDVGYAPSAAAFVALERRPEAAARRRALLLGDPVYASEAGPSLLAARGPAWRDWPRIPRTRQEVLRVATLLLTDEDTPRSREDLFRLTQLGTDRDLAFSSPDFELRLGEEASVDTLTELMPSASVIHIAAHAHVDRLDARRSGLVLAWEPETQGLLGISDIAALRTDAELVILSACQTADGRLLTDGVQSLASAFLMAGARSVVATLWSVQDDDAEIIVTSLAEALLAEGVPADRALREAKRALRGSTERRGRAIARTPIESRRAHPHHWAAYLLTGAPPR